MNEDCDGLSTTAECAPRGAGQVANAPLPAAPNPFRTVRIDKVANGFILQIGCQTFVAKTWTEASGGLAEYYEDPVAAEKNIVNNNPCFAIIWKP